MYYYIFFPSVLKFTFHTIFCTAHNLQKPCHHPPGSIKYYQV